MSNLALRIDAIESVIHGARTKLRPARPDESRKVFDWAIDPNVAPLWGGRGYYRDFESFLRDWRPYYFDGSQPELGRCLMIEAPTDGVADETATIGMIATNAIDTHNRSVEFDILIGESGYRDRGFGTDAIRTLVRFLFDTVGLHRVWVGTYEHNVRAQRAYEKVGFLREGLLREADWVEDRWVNVVVYGLLDHEFLEINH